MSQHIGHLQCYELLERVLLAYEGSGYTRLVQYAPGQSVLMDSRPAPGYVPGVLGKKETGVEYTPLADGTRIHIYYVAGHKASPKQRAEAERANRSGFDSHEIMGTLVSIRRMGDGIQLQFVAGNRDNIEDGVITNKIALRSVSITREPAAKGGMIVALALDQSLGIPYHMLKALLESETNNNITALSAGLRAIRNQVTQSQADPSTNPSQQPASGATPSPEVEVE
jgi:hypothetical protein